MSVPSGRRHRPRIVTILRSAAALILLSAAAAVAQTIYPVTAVTTTGSEITSATVSGQVYGRNRMVGATVTAFKGASAGIVLVPNGTPPPAAGTRAGLLGDWFLDSGLLNPHTDADSVVVTFPQPIVNRQGVDVMIFEINTGASADPCNVKINGSTLAVPGANWGNTAFGTTSADHYNASSFGTLAALQSATLSVASLEIGQTVWGFALDFSHFGVADGASISSISVWSSGANTFDPVLIAGIIPPPELTNGPVIEEFMADNVDTLEDEDTDAPDWIEIYNGQDASVNLSGWKLSNDPAVPGKWTFPSLTLPPFGSTIVYASGKNRLTSVRPHTNFTLQKESGTIVLSRPDGSVASNITYGAQVEDISYGAKDAAQTLGYLELATPGQANIGRQAAGPPAEDAKFSREGGLITGAVQLSISPPVEAGAVVRYTLDNTEPSETSPTYSTPFNISTTTTVRARVFVPNKLPGQVSSRTFLLLDTSLTNYNGSGQPFSSNLPIVVLDSYGVAVDASTSASSRPFRSTYGVVIDTNPGTGRAAITDPSSFQNRGGTHVRGESSAGFGQKQYTWEIWDNRDQDKDVSILGFPEDSDFILYAPWSEKTLMRDHLVFSLMRRLRSEYMAVRARHCEVFFNQAGGTSITYAGSYKGVYLFKEKIKRGNDRVNIEKLNDLTVAQPDVTGGYIFRKDKTDVDSTPLTSTLGITGLQSFDPDFLNSAQQTYLNNYIATLEASLPPTSGGTPPWNYPNYLEEDTFIDAQWFVEWTKQVDGYVFSTYFHKDRNAKLRAGPIWDFNIAIGNANYGSGDTATGWLYNVANGVGQIWYPRLHNDPGYKLKHWDRFWVLRRGLFATSAILADIDATASLLLNGSTTAVTNNMAALPPTQENAVMRQYRKYQRLGLYDWPNPNGFESRTTYQSEVDYMKNWLTTRLAWLDDQFVTGTAILRPPDFSSLGGNVAAGTQLAISAYTGTPPSGFTYATGTLYYTTNGSDPRGSNGLPAGSTYSGPLTLNDSMTVKARLYTGSAWSPLTSANFIVNAVPATSSNIIVSELLYHPVDPTAAEIAAGYDSANDFEYIELLNVSAQSVDLSGVTLGDAVTFNFSLGDPTALTLPAGGRVVVVENLNAFLARYGNNPAVKIAGVFTGNFSNGGELVTVRAANNAIIQQFTYADTEPWPVDADFGYSLVFNRPAENLSQTSGSNWRSSALIGGTPGLANSQPFNGQPNGDTDFDGFLDFFEYATGTNLASNASQRPPVAGPATYVVNGVPATYLQFSFQRSLAAEASFVVELSEGLPTWQSDASAVTYVGTENNGDGTATVTYRSSQPLDPSRPQMFMRLRVSP